MTIRTWARKRRLSTKLHLAVDAHGLLIRAIIAQGVTTDRTQAALLIDGFTTENLTNYGYYSGALLA